MPTTQIVLVRHGLTDGNSGTKSPVLLGWTDVLLSATGRKEADRLRDRLAPETWSAVYSSSSRRALETAHRAVPAAWQRRIQILDQLREIDCGAVDGKSIEAVKREHADVWQRNEREDDPHFRWPGGESYAELRARSLAVLDRIVADNPARRVLVFTHAGFISQIMGALHDLSPAQWRRFRPGTCALTEVAWGDTRHLVSFDDHRHLDR